MNLKLFHGHTLGYKVTGMFSLKILPSIEIYKDSVFKEQYFEINFDWLFWYFTIEFTKNITEVN